MSIKKPSVEKIGSIVPFGLRMPPELKSRVEDAAKENKRSLNTEITYRLQQSFEHSGAAPDELRITLDATKVPVSMMESMVLISEMFQHAKVPFKQITVLTITPEQADQSKTNIEQANELSQRLREARERAEAQEKAYQDRRKEQRNA